ncbi:MAG TPA: hypothetical protein DHV59_11435 [Oxalobacteraceae bacterium]|nr:hypothetical protein [Oxalobacteraceae bacterium]
MNNRMSLVEFECEGHRFALPLASVRRAIPSAQPAPLPGATENVLGVLNLGAEIAIVINFHRRVGLPFSEMGVSQQLLLIDIPGACLGLVVDRVTGVKVCEVDDGPGIPGQFAADVCVSTIVRVKDGLCIICDPEKFLRDDEKLLINEAIAQHIHAAH